MRNYMTRNNTNKNECICGVPRKEKEVVLNGIPIKALVCPKCGYTIFSGEELQSYFDKMRLNKIQMLGSVRRG